MKVSSISDKWVMCSKPNPKADLRLFCFPYAGGGASSFSNWAWQLPANIEVSAVQLPGRENRLNEPLYTKLEDLIKVLSDALYTYMDMPFAFFGHSMGAILSYALACKLREQHRTGPVYLAVSGRRAPHLPRKHVPFYKLPDEQLTERMRLFDGTSETILHNPELMAIFLPVLRADLEINDVNYKNPVSERLHCPISAFGGLQDEYVSREELAAWQDHTSGSFNLNMYHGGHFYLLNDRETFLKQLGSLLADAL